MAGLLLNNCTYPDCRKKFSTLSDLIYHIEEEHIDFSPSIIEEKELQKVQYISLSYVLRYSHLFYRGSEIKEAAASSRKTIGQYKPESIQNTIGRDTVLIESEISDDSWNDDNSEFTNYPRRSSDIDHLNKEEYLNRTKRFACPVPGCNKRYKNINGIKYHTRNSHEIRKSPLKPKKMHKCHCGKLYKTIQGLKAHSISHREFNISLHKISGHSGLHLVPSQKIGHSENVYAHPSEIIKSRQKNKTDIVEDEMLSYPYMDPPPKLSENNTEYEHNTSGHFGFFAPPYSYGNYSTNEGFTDNLMLDESVNQNYQYTLTYKKY